MKAKAKQDYRSYLGSQLANKAKEVAEKLTGSTKFPAPTPLPAALEELADDYNESVQEAASGSKYAKATRNALRTQLLADMSNVAQYVNSLADGDREAIVLTGLDVNKEAQPSVLAVPTNLQILQGDEPGQMVSKLPKPQGAKSISHMYTPAPLTSSSVWVTVPSTVTKAIFNGLEEGALYHFKVCAVGSRQQRTYSDVVSQYVLRRSMESAA